MDIRLLGTLEVLVKGRSVALGGLRQRAVFAALCVRANEVVSTDRLIDDVWGGEPPSSVSTTLRAYLSNLRKSLAESHASIESRRPGYVLVVDPWAIDIVRFDHLAERGRDLLAAGSFADAAETLREALALWQGPALADFTYETFAEALIARFEEQRLVTVEQRVEADLACGRAAELVGELRELVAQHPLREVLRGHLMRALHLSGQRGEALRVYQEGRHRSIEELGLDPSHALQSLEQSILLEDGTPSPPTMAPAGSNLPAALTTFIGRKAEMATVGRLIEANRLVTLTGTGGSGKTRLALEVAAAESDRRRRDGAWLIELAPVATVNGVVDAIASALGVARVPGVAPLDGVLTAIGVSAPLLLVDNCEHVRDAASEVVHTLLRRCPNVRIVATSREPLRVPGEMLWRVPSLAVPTRDSEAAVDEALGFDAVRLFVDRAARVIPDFELTPTSAPVVGEIVRRLDGIPLALELAAARLDALSLRQVADLIDDRFRLLASDSAVVVPRHRTLRAVVDFSFDLLSERERLLFRRVSVFAGVFDLDLASEVCAYGELAEPDVMNTLSRLVACSVVARVDDAGDVAHYRLLETLRAYGRERLAEAHEEDVVRERHSRACTRRAREAGSHAFAADSAEWLDQVEASHEDHRSALAWLLSRGDGEGAIELATALWPFWVERFYIAEGREWLRRSLDIARPDSVRRAAALAAAADLAFWDDDFEFIDEACTEALPIAAAADESAIRAQLLLTASEAARERDDLARSANLANESLLVARRRSLPAREADALRVLAMLAADAGDLAGAEALAEESASAARSAGHVGLMAAAAGTLGSLAQARGDLVRARGLFEEALRHSRARGERWGEARALGKLGTLAMASGDSSKAYELGAEGLAIYERLRSNDGIAESLLVMADAARMGGDLEQADLLASAALTQCRNRGFSSQLMWALVASGGLAFRRGDLEAAESHLEEAVQLFERGQTRYAAPALLLLGLTRGRRGAPDASSLCQQSLELFRDAGDERGTARALLALAELALLADEPLASLRYLSAARSTGRINEVRAMEADGQDYLDLLRRVRAVVPAAKFDEVWAMDPDGASVPEAGTSPAQPQSK